MATKIGTDDILTVDYDKRKFILVLPDEVIAQLKKEQEDPQAKNIDWKKLASKLIIPATQSIGGIIVDIGFAAYSRHKEARRDSLKAVQISFGEAKKLRFPVGHPQENILYVGHPLKANTYYTISQFHRMTFEDKFAELIDLLVNLGATEIYVESEEGWSMEFASSLTLSSLFTNHAEAFGGIKNNKNSSILFEAKFGGSKNPKIPDSLVWYKHDNILNSLAKSRLNNALKEFSFELTYTDDFGITLGIKSQVQDAGFDLGGNFEEFKKTIWKIKATFLT